MCPFWCSLTIFSDLPFVAVCCDFPSTAKLGYSTPRWTYRTGSVGLAAALLRFLPASEQRRRRRRAAPAERLAADGEPCSVSLSLSVAGRKEQQFQLESDQKRRKKRVLVFLLSVCVIDRVLLSFKCRVSKIGATRLLPREKRSQSAKSPFKSVRSRSSLIPF